MRPLFFLIFLVLAVPMFGQRLEPVMPAPSEVPKEWRPTYRRLLREDAERLRRAQDAGYDIVLPTEEQVPTLLSPASSTQNQTNWGRDVLLPPALVSRIVAECTRPIVVKVADTGGNLTHPDLQTGQMQGSSYTGEPSMDDGNGHATHCAGIIAARNLGLCWPLVQAGRVRFKAVKVLTNSGSGSFSWVANAYAAERAQDNQLRAGGTAVVYTNSFGGGTQTVDVVEREIQASVQAGHYFVFANGNTGPQGGVNYPALSPLVLACASLDQSMTVSSYSSRGPETDNAMPGRNINSTWKDGAYAVLSGTSMATPFLAGAAVIALSKWGIQRIPNQAALEAYFQRVATDINPPGRDNDTGWGVVFIQRILDTEPQGGTPPPPPPPPPPTDPTPVIQAVTVLTDGYIIRWARAGEQGLRAMNIAEIELYADGKTAEESVDRARQYAREFFSSHSIQVPANMNLVDAAWWAGQFFEYWGKNNGKPVQVLTLRANDEQGRSVIVTGFDRADLPSEYGSTAPVLQRIR